MNWIKKLKKIENKTAKTKSKKHNCLDSQLLCCSYPKNRRKNPYKPNKMVEPFKR